MNNNSYIKSLDGVRFWAVSLVLADHWSGDKLGFPAGYLGVCLFFVLSGFLITGILMDAKKKDENLGRGHGFSLKQFYIRRTLRIFPLYYITLAVLFLLNIPPVREKFWWLVTYMINNYMAIYQTWMGSVDHLWSLAVEEQFYIFFPFLVLFLPLGKIRNVLVFFIPLAIGLRLYLFLHQASWISSYVLMPTCLDAFGLGGLLAYWRKTGNDKMLSLFKSNIYLAISLLIYIFVVLLYRNQGTNHNFYDMVVLRFAEALFSVFLIGRLLFIDRAASKDTFFKYFSENNVAVYIGKISYGVYLLHNFVFNEYHSGANHPTRKLLEHLGAVWPGFGTGNLVILKIILLYVITIAIASLSWYAIERPVNRLKDKFGY